MPVTLPAAVRRLLLSTEGVLLVVGAAGALALVLGLAIGWILAPGPTSLLAAMTGLNLVVGPVAGLSFGYANGFGHLLVIADASLIEALQVLIVFPLFLLSWNRLVDLPRLRPWLTRIQVRAEAQQHWVRPLGIAGVFLFVLVPFWMTGPIVGAIIGFLIGLGTVQNLVIVLTANSLAISGWALSIYELGRATAGMGRYAAFAAALALALIALTWQVLMHARARNAQAASGPDAGPAAGANAASAAGGRR